MFAASRRFLWIMLLLIALPLKGWAMAGGLHCMSETAASAQAASQTASQKVDHCHEHMGAGMSMDDGASHAGHDGTPGDADDPGGQHSCSVCAHCNTGTAPPSAWVPTAAQDRVHAAPQQGHHPWRSALTRRLDRPPTARLA